MRTLAFAAIGLLCCVIAMVAWQATPAPRNDVGKQLAATYCASCHVQPMPDVLDKATWIAKVFPTMRQYMGMDPVKDLGPMEHELRSFYPLFPTMTEDEWFAVASYYISEAPSRLTPAPRPTINPSTTRWKADTATIRSYPPLTTLCMLDPTRSLLLIGDGLQSKLHIAQLDGTVRSTLSLKGPPVSVVIRPKGWLVTDMGKLLPHDSAVGTLWNVQWQPTTSTAVATKVLDTLRRPTHVAVADLDGDGREDYLVCEYGNLIGRFGYYSPSANGKMRYKNFIPLPGAVRALIRDINADGLPDVVVLMAQAREGVFAFINKGKGRFTERALATFHPAFGASFFDLVDIDGDKDLDLIVANGDNGDYDSPPYKPYHGVHMFTNDGKLNFTETTFLPQNGAYGAAVRDFDLDGDLDVISIAYFPDLRQNASESIVYWECQADGSFLPSTIAEGNLGRWLVFDCADVDNDGDLDIILGNAAMGPGNIPDDQRKSWMTDGRLYLLIRNQTR